MRLTLLTCALVALHSGAPSEDSATRPPSLDDLFAVALREALVDPQDLTGLHLIEGAEIVVRSDIPDSPIRIGASALPSVHGKALRLLSTEQIRHRAVFRGDQYVVAVSELSRVDENHAEFYIGVEMVTWPSRPVLCCCSKKARYERVDGTWVYRGANEFSCA